MSDSKSKAASGGIGIFGLLTVAFIVLKIVNVDPIGTWPWFSFNPFTWSVLMFFITWPLFLFLVIGGIILLIAILSSKR